MNEKPQMWLTKWLWLQRERSSPDFSLLGHVDLRATLGNMGQCVGPPRLLRRSRGPWGWTFLDSKTMRIIGGLCTVRSLTRPCWLTPLAHFFFLLSLWLRYLSPRARAHTETCIYLGNIYVRSGASIGIVGSGVCQCIIARVAILCIWVVFLHCGISVMKVFKNWISWLWTCEWM